MLTLGRAVAATLLVGGVLTASTEVAFAGDGYGNCDQQSGTATCTVGVDVPGSTPSPSSDGSGSGSGGSSGNSSPKPSSSPSRTLDLACTYQADPTYTPPAGSDPHPAGSGAWYLMTCPDVLSPSGNAFTTQTTIVWLASPPATAPDPATLAASAESQLKLGTPAIETSPRPGLATFPGVNVWAWVPASSWSSKSATATAAGESVTVTATPTYSTWNFGDGVTVTCQGPGTVYQASDGPNPVSPTCGHAYTQPGSYAETVTVHWRVTWKGAGQAGAFNDLTTTTRAPVTVGESEAVVTR